MRMYKDESFKCKDKDVRGQNYFRIESVLNVFVVWEVIYTRRLWPAFVKLYARGMR